MNVMAEGLSRYQTHPPTDVVILHDRQSLNDYVRINPNGMLHAENGGYYLKDMEDVVIAIASDDLCNELDGAWASAEAAADALDAAEKNYGSGSVSDANFEKRNEDLSCYPSCKQNYCSHPRCFLHATCLSYSHCHVCGTRKVCL